MSATLSKDVAVYNQQGNIVALNSVISITSNLVGKVRKYIKPHEYFMAVKEMKQMELNGKNGTVEYTECQNQIIFQRQLREVYVYRLSTIMENDGSEGSEGSEKSSREITDSSESSEESERRKRHLRSKFSEISFYSKINQYSEMTENNERYQHSENSEDYTNSEMRTDLVKKSENSEGSARSESSGLSDSSAKSGSTDYSERCEYSAESENSECIVFSEVSEISARSDCSRRSESNEGNSENSKNSKFLTRTGYVTLSDYGDRSQYNENGEHIVYTRVGQKVEYLYRDGHIIYWVRECSENSVERQANLYNPVESLSIEEIENSEYSGESKDYQVVLYDPDNPFNALRTVLTKSSSSSVTIENEGNIENSYDRYTDRREYNEQGCGVHITQNEEGYHFGDYNHYRKYYKKRGLINSIKDEYREYKEFCRKNEHMDYATYETLANDIKQSSSDANENTSEYDEYDMSEEYNRSDAYYRSNEHDWSYEYDGSNDFFRTDMYDGSDEYDKSNDNNRSYDHNNDDNDRSDDSDSSDKCGKEEEDSNELTDGFDEGNNFVYIKNREKIEYQLESDLPIYWRVPRGKGSDSNEGMFSQAAMSDTSEFTLPITIKEIFDSDESCDSEESYSSEHICGVYGSEEHESEEVYGSRDVIDPNEKLSPEKICETKQVFNSDKIYQPEDVTKMSYMFNLYAIFDSGRIFNFEEMFDLRELLKSAEGQYGSEIKMKINWRRAIEIPIYIPTVTSAHFFEPMLGRRMEIDLTDQPSIVDMLHLYTFLSARGEFHPDTIIHVLMVRHLNTMKPRDKMLTQLNNLDKHITRTILIFLCLTAVIIYYIFYMEWKSQKYLLGKRKRFYFF